MQHQNTQDARLQRLALLSQMAGQQQQQSQTQQTGMFDTLGKLYGISREQQLLPAQLAGLQLANQGEQMKIGYMPEQFANESALNAAKVGEAGASTTAELARGRNLDASTAAMPDRVTAAQDRAAGSMANAAYIGQLMHWTPEQTMSFIHGKMPDGSTIGKPSMPPGPFGQPDAQAAPVTPVFPATQTMSYPDPTGFGSNTQIPVAPAASSANPGIMPQDYSWMMQQPNTPVPSLNLPAILMHLLKPQTWAPPVG